MSGARRRVRAAGRGRWWRWPMRVLGAYVGGFLLAYGLIFAGWGLAQQLGPDLEEIAIAGVPDLRRIDDRVLISGQPQPRAYEALQQLGVTTVLTLRTGAPWDPRSNDVELLRSLGIRYVNVPLVDGRAPEPHQVRAVLEAIESSEGDVLLHCGGGVGRVTSVAQAYRALEHRADPGAFDLLVAGPPTPEQIVYVARLEPGQLVDPHPIVAGISRYWLDAPRAAGNWVLGHLR